MDLILECRSIGFNYRDQVILKDITFEVRKGRFCVILGRNGSGKTTLLHCLNRILTPASGKILVHGKPLMSLSRSEIARAISLVPQEHIDIFPFSVMDVVVMGRSPFLKMTSSPDEADYRTAMDALKELNAQSLSDKNFNRISGGERQIVLLARALAQSTPVMLLDEPTNHLDFNNQYHLLASMKQLCRTKGISVVASMHDPNMASLFADQVIMLNNGRIMAGGNRDEVMNEKNISNLYDIGSRKIMIGSRKKMFVPEHVLTSNFEVD